VARRDRLIADAQPAAIVRASRSDFSALLELLFRRYPHREWATFIRLGWRQTDRGSILTLAALDPPTPRDLDETADHVVIQEPYSLRTALAAEAHPLAIGVVHSHPEGYSTHPSSIDDDMDSYYASYFGNFAPDRPYVSLIFSKSEEDLRGSGRVWWQGRWHPVGNFIVPQEFIRVDSAEPPHPRSRRKSFERVERLATAFGEEAAERLRDASVGVLGAGGTGSAAIEVLARAGVGRIVSVDPENFASSNLERVHGSTDEDVRLEPPKVGIAARHVYSIDPAMEFIAIRGRLPQREVVDALLDMDVVLGCTDKQYSRVAASDLSLRHLVPVFDCGVHLEGMRGAITGQIVQLMRCFPDDPCPFCRDMVNPVRMSQELMTPEEREMRRAAAASAVARGEAADPYWQNEPQLNTVGYLTTTAGALVAGYAIGMITGRFLAPFSRLQLDLSADLLGTVDIPAPPKAHCACRRVRGWSDQGIADALISAPAHWPAPVVVEAIDV
jgi:molybdopterin/thiamine biosynthesis adenylyltransferase